MIWWGTRGQESIEASGPRLHLFCRLPCAIKVIEYHSQDMYVREDSQSCRAVTHRKTTHSNQTRADPIERALRQYTGSTVPLNAEAQMR
jgi:hypothetical protein